MLYLDRLQHNLNIDQTMLPRCSLFDNMLIEKLAALDRMGRCSWWSRRVWQPPGDFYFSHVNICFATAWLCMLQLALPFYSCNLFFSTHAPLCLCVCFLLSSVEESIKHVLHSSTCCRTLTHDGTCRCTHP